jgi:glycosyltransferase involved in cell wall biosynthesis
MEVCFIPFDKGNPYQRLLAGHLEKLGTVVHTNLDHPDLVPGRPLPPCIHLHWIRPLSLRPERLRQGLRHLRNLRSLASGRTRVIWTAHNIIPHDCKYPWLERWYSRRIARVSSAVIAHSPRAKSLLLSQLGDGLDAKVHVIPHGHYLDAYPNTVSASEARHHLRLPSDALVALAFGALRPYKGLDALIRYWSTARTPAHLVIAGKAHMRSTAAELNHLAAGAPRVHLFEGFVQEPEVQHFMNAADFVVFPYRRILSSGALILAMSFAKACVAPRIGSLSDYLTTDGALLYDPDHEDGLHSAIDKAIALGDQLAAMGRANRERAARWDWDPIARATQCLYAGQRPTPATGWW